ncbi:MAG: phosphotransferase [Oceanospirillaceae bacterium]|jgi:Ser/Thr protein kinase RdoA (MazF antagonist)|nr:phosphotransferase [Oceanospirillaceae bacterium]
MRGLGIRACQLWGWQNAEILLVAQRENTTFKISPAHNAHFALRVHRPGYHSPSQLEAELVWLQHLGGQGLAVAVPVASSKGLLLEQLDGYQVSVLHWFDGQAMGQSRQPLQLQHGPQVFYALGQSMARLHQISDVWCGNTNLDRPRWDLDGLLGEQPLWGAFWQNPQLTDEQIKCLLEARSRLRSDFIKWIPQLDFGLIHADLVRENVLLSGVEPQLIDFDDSGFGFRLFDLATTLLANVDEPNYPQLKAQLIAGYRTIRPIDVAHLQAFMLVRSLTYVGWIVPRITEQGAHERCQRFIARAMAMAQEYLAITAEV